MRGHSVASSGVSTSSVGGGALAGTPRPTFRRRRARSSRCAVAAHLIGTGVVLVLLVFVLPVPPEFEGWTPGSVQLLLQNLVAAIAYVGLIVPAAAAPLAVPRAAPQRPSACV